MARSGNRCFPRRAARDDPGTGQLWATDYDWRKFEERFAALPHFITKIDGVDIHFIHVRSEQENALPLIVTLVLGTQADRGPTGFRVLIDAEPPDGACGLDVDERGNGTVSEVEHRFGASIRWSERESPA